MYKRQILDDARKKAKKQEAEILEEARAEAGRILERASREIDLEKKKALEDVKTEIVSIASLMAGKAVAASMDVKLQDSLIQETLKEMGESTWQKMCIRDRDQSLKERRAYKFSVFTGQRSHKEQYGDQGHINESCDSCRMKALFLLGRNFIQLGVSGALVFSKTRLDHVYRAPSNNKGAEEGGCDHEEPVTGCVYGKGGFWHERLDLSLIHI